MARPLLIAGPCSAETEAQVMTTARALRGEGITLFRAGLWKPRTRPGSFEGVGEVGLPWLQRVQHELGMKVATEVATAAHVEAALSAGIDLLWVGARTVANPFAMQDIAEALSGHDVPVLVKNPVSPDINLWIGAMQRLYAAGIRRMAAVHRGIPTYEQQTYRNTPLWQLPIELRRRFPTLPLLVDPSHIGGKRELVAPLAQRALDLGFDGLIIESHCCPEKAWSDAAQQVTPQELATIVKGLRLRQGTSESEDLRLMRSEIDACDEALLSTLARRMQISREIGAYKHAHGISIVQQERYNTIVERCCAAGEAQGLDAAFVRRIFETIHEESVNQQE